MEEKKIQLFCIPFAGGSSRSFAELANEVDPFIEVIPIAYPGRGIRAHDSFFTRYEDLVLDVKKQIISKRNSNIPFALLGYSMGSAVAYDLLQSYLEEKPIHVFICAREALDCEIESKNYSLLEEDAFIEKVEHLGGIDKRIAQNPRFLKIYMRPVYADYKLWHQHNFDASKPIPKTDITAFFCDNDTPRERVMRWRNLTKGSVDFYEYGENHFFIFKHAKEMGSVISRKLYGKVINSYGI